MIIALFMTTMCLSNAKGEEEKVSTHQRRIPQAWFLSD